MAFECRVEADSLAPCGARLTTFVVTYPRAIHSEIMTHRMLTKSSASSRAIPTPFLIDRVLLDPWVPEYIGKNQRGMQAGEMLAEDQRVLAVQDWLDLRDNAVEKARRLHARGVHKQIVNRIIEPWMWITVVISGTDWDNFFGLRCHEAAEPHFQHIARMMQEAYISSVPVVLGAGRWHLPFVSREDILTIQEQQYYEIPLDQRVEKMQAESTQRGQFADYGKAGCHLWEALIKISVGRCARVSYLNHEGKRDFQADIDLHDRLLVQRPLHAAPAEHVAQAMDWPVGFGPLTVFKDPQEVRSVLAERLRTDLRLDAFELSTLDMAEVCARMQSGNYMGFKQYRKTLAHENIGGSML